MPNLLQTPRQLLLLNYERGVASVLQSGYMATKRKKC
jgi:hypothetical protein